MIIQSGVRHVWEWGHRYIYDYKKWGEAWHVWEWGKVPWAS